MAISDPDHPIVRLPGWETRDGYVSALRGQLTPRLLCVGCGDLPGVGALASEQRLDLEKPQSLADVRFPSGPVPALLLLRESELRDHPAFVATFRDAASGCNTGVVVVLDADEEVDLAPLEPHVLGTVPAGTSPRVLRDTLRQAFDHLMARLRAEWLEEDCRRLSGEMAELQAVGLALSAARPLESLLELILSKAREIAEADSGTLWVVEERPDGRMLRNKLAQNDSVDIDHREFAVPVSARSIAGYVALTGESLNIEDVYDLPVEGEPSSAGSRAFDQDIGYRTKSMLAVPVHNREGHILGVIQLMNRKKDPAAVVKSLAELEAQVIPFSAHRVAMLQCLAGFAGVALENAQKELALHRESRRTRVLLEVMRSFSERLDLEPLLQEIMHKTVEVLDADRCTLFLVDERAGELWSKVGQGLGTKEIRFPKHLGIAGHVATSGETVNIPEAYEDARFNREIDRATGYRTRTILCMPVRDETARIIGVTQVLNKREGIFTDEDERLLEAVSSQAAVALKNAQLFEEVLNMKNYNESILRSIATGVLTLDPTGKITGINPAASRMLKLDETALGCGYGEVFNEVRNPRIVGAIQTALTTMTEMSAYELNAALPGGDSVNLNLNVVPLRDWQEEPVGVVVVAQDITREQRLMSSLSRYLSPEVAESAIRQGDLKLGGSMQRVAVLFSDIRSYTTLTESREAEEIVGWLNCYFSRMVPLVFKYKGMLDKYIGDAIMAVYGVPVRLEHMADYALWSAIEMRRMLRVHNAERVALGQPTIDAGIGLCMGEATYGNIGSEERMDITVIGDTVNVSARLETLTKEFDQKLLVSENVIESLHYRDLPWVDLGKELVKGKTQAIRIFGLPDEFILGEIALPPIIAEIGEPVLPDLRAPVAELAGRLEELLKSCRP